MPHVTDTLWNSILTKLKNAKILIMGTTERMTLKIHVDHLIDAISKNCPNLERLEFRYNDIIKIKYYLNSIQETHRLLSIFSYRWDNDTLRFSDKNQKAVDMLRTKCLQMQSLVLSDGKLYEIMRGNFERADRRAVIRTGVNCKVTTHYLLTNYEEMLFT